MIETCDKKEMNAQLYVRKYEVVYYNSIYNASRGGASLSRSLTYSVLRLSRYTYITSDGV